LSFDNGSTAYVNATFHLDLPAIAGYISQVQVIDTGGNGSNRAIYLYENKAASSYYTTQVNGSFIYVNGTFSSDAMVQRGLWRFFEAHTRIDNTKGRIYGCVRSNGTNAVNGTAMAYTVIVGGFGLN
jgi:hypothetical protein